MTEGRVGVNGVRVTEPGSKADPDTDDITVDGRPISAGQPRVYLMLHKPVGYTSTRYDVHAAKTVVDLVRDVDAFVYPVGRLDVDTSGLLIITNDGEFAQELTHPSRLVDKRYIAEIDGRITSRHLDQLARGVELEDGMTAPARARLLRYSTSDGVSSVELIIHEGRKRQVRRMFKAVGHRVLKLHRAAVGELELGSLKPGQYRALTRGEIAKLRRRRDV